MIEVSRGGEKAGAQPGGQPAEDQAPGALDIILSQGGRQLAQQVRSVFGGYCVDEVVDVRPEIGCCGCPGEAAVVRRLRVDRR